MKRRTFLQHAVQATFLPLLPALSTPALANDSFSNSSSDTRRKRVILLELAGANDGLNTVVPWSHDAYHELRPTIGLNRKSIITLDDDYGFHHKLEPLMPLWEASDLAVIHGLGYPKPNRSHFKSIALWETGGDGNNRGKRGWLTHDIEHAYASSEVDAHGIVLGGSMGIFSNAQGNWLSMTAANQFIGRNSDASIGTRLPTRDAAQNPVMELLVDRAKTLKSSLDRISSKISSVHHNARIRGNSRLSQQLTHTVNLINAGIDAPVFKVSLGGFDTHENQPARHARLLQKLSLTLNDLRRELIKSDQWQNTIVMTYSEFGRRVAENDSRGTDHGTAAAHLLAGGAVNGGFFGNAPDLTSLSDGDLSYTMDYRSVYNRLLTDWLELPTDSFSQYRDTRLDAIVS